MVRVVACKCRVLALRVQFRLIVDLGEVDAVRLARLLLLDLPVFCVDFRLQKVGCFFRWCCWVQGEALD